MSDLKPNNVPKFASFRPKPPIQTSDEANLKAEEGSNDHSKHKNKGEERRRHRKKHQSKSREAIPVDIVTLRPTPAIPFGVPLDDQPAIFVVDKKGDVKNITYGSVHRYDVPPYYRYGAGCVLGAPLNMRIDRDSRDEKGIVLSNFRDSTQRSRERHVFSKIAIERPRLLKIRPEVIVEDQAILEADFISLQQRKRRKRGSSSEGLDSDSGQEGSNYRSIYSKTRSKDQPDDSHFEYATESEASGSDSGRALKLDTVVRQKNIELSHSVEKNPHDISGWLALIGHQDKLIRPDNERRRMTNAEISSTADIKIHMYEKALENSGSLVDRERLLLGLMAEGAKIWELKVQADRWRKIAEENIESIVLWTSYLNFRQSTFSEFRYEEVKEVYLSRIKTISRAIAIAPPGSDHSFYHQLIYVILRLTLFIRESGYSELALAIWQGLLELNFFAPKKQEQRQNSLEASFKDFWDAEVPRFGENGALGWCHYVENQTEMDASEMLVDVTTDSLEPNHLFRTWVTAERLRSKDSRLPARTMDEVVEDDPFRVILFSDIEGCLLALPPQADDLRMACIDGFFMFCRLPPILSIHQEGVSRSVSDPFVNGSLFEFDETWIKDKLLAPSAEVEGSGQQSSQSMQNLGLLQTRNEIAADYLNNAVENWRDRYPDDTGPVSYIFIRTCLRQLRRVYLSVEFLEYYLLFESENEPDTIKKTAKSLLKENPTSLRLYNAYAKIEWSRGNKEIAHEVFSAALGMRISTTRKELDVDAIVLWRTWVWASLRALDNASALRHILSIPYGKPDSSVVLTPTVHLKVKQHLFSSRDFLLSAGDIEHSVLYSECLALLEYLSGSLVTRSTTKAQGDINSALVIYTAFSKTLEERKQVAVFHEKFLESAAHLLYLHAKTGPFRPALIREYLAKFLTLFPANLLFLSIFDWNETRLRINNRVRNLLFSTVLTNENDTLSSRHFAIKYEINHGTIHSVRSAFEHALSSPVCKSSAGLWRAYLFYCLKTPEFRSQVKELWYRALRDCPWAKELYLFGFENLRGLVGFEELRSAWRIMGEKELRVHVDLEDDFEDMGSA